MVDARIPERYLVDRRVLRLTDAERSSLFMATVWSVSNRTDGRVERRDLTLISTFRESAIPALVGEGLWAPDGPDAWTIVDYVRDQTSRDELEVLENARRRDREKKRRQRSKSQGTIPGDGPGGQHRIGKARQELEQGQDDDGVDQRTGEVTSWPTAKPGEPGAWVQTGDGEFSEVGAA